MAASCTYHPPVLISQLPLKSQTNKNNTPAFKKKYRRMFWKNSEENGPLAENDKTDRATELGTKTKGKTVREIAWQCWDSRQEGDIRHHWPLFGGGWGETDWQTQREWYRQKFSPHIIFRWHTKRFTPKVKIQVSTCAITRCLHWTPTVFLQGICADM